MQVRHYNSPILKQFIYAGTKIFLELVKQEGKYVATEYITVCSDQIQMWQQIYMCSKAYWEMRNIGSPCGSLYKLLPCPYGTEGI